MDLWDVAKVMWRRRWVAVPLLLLSVVAAIFALLTVPPDYSAKAQVAAVPANQVSGGARPGETATVNSFRADTLAELVAIYLNRPEVRRQMVANGLSGEYEITVKTFGLAVLELKVMAKSRDQVTTTLDRLIEMIKSEFVRNQPNLKPAESISNNVLDRGEEITVVRTVGKRTLIVIVGVGVLVTVAISLWVDALVRRRNLRVPEFSEARASVPVSPAVGMMGPPVAYQPNAANASTVSLDGERQDNDSTIVLPLAGVSWTNAKGSKRDTGEAPGGAKAR